MTALAKELMIEALASSLSLDQFASKADNIQADEEDVSFLSELLAQKLSASSLEKGNVTVDAKLMDLVKEVLSDASDEMIVDIEDEAVLEHKIASNISLPPELLDQLVAYLEQQSTIAAEDTETIPQNRIREIIDAIDDEMPLPKAAIAESIKNESALAETVLPKTYPDKVDLGQPVKDAKPTNLIVSDESTSDEIQNIPVQVVEDTTKPLNSTPQLTPFSQAKTTQAAQTAKEDDLRADHFPAETEKPSIQKAQPVVKNEVVQEFKTDKKTSELTKELTLPPEEELQLEPTRLPSEGVRAAEIIREDAPRAEVTLKKTEATPPLAANLGSDIKKEQTVALTSFETMVLPPRSGDEQPKPQPIQFAFGHHTNAQGDTHLRINLLPPELGHIRVDLKVDGMTGEKTVNMIFALPQTFDMFKENTQSLQQMLLRAGYDVGTEQINLQHPGEQLREDLQNFFAKQHQHEEKQNQTRDFLGDPQDEDENDDPVMTHVNQLVNVNA